MEVITMTTQNGAVTGLDVSRAIRTTYTIPANGQPNSRLIDKTSGSVEMWELDSPIEIDGSEFYAILLDADYAKINKASAYENEEAWLRKYIGPYGAWRKSKSGGRHFIVLLPRELAVKGLIQRTGLKALGSVDLLTKRVWGNRVEFPWQDIDTPLPIVGQEFIDEFSLMENGSRAGTFTPSDVVLSGFKLQVAEITTTSHRIDPPSGSWSIAGSGRETALWSAALNYANDLYKRLKDPDDVWAGMVLFIEQYLPLIPEEWARSFDAFERHNPSLRTRFLNDEYEIATPATRATGFPRDTPLIDDTLDAARVTQGHLGTALGEGVPLAQTLDEIAAFNRQFIFHKDDSTHDVIALWIVHTYAMDRWSITPRLYINAPQAGVGKSTQGKVIQFLSNNGIKSGSATPAFIFAKVSEHKGSVTVLLDEADNIWAKGRDTADLQSLINEGYEYGATVGRGNSTDAGIVGNTYEAYCPVVIIGIKNSRIPATTLDRCINIKMSLPDRANAIERFIARKYESLCISFRERIQQSALCLPEYEEMEPPKGLSFRVWDIWEPLFIIAREAGGDWPERVARAAQKMNSLEPVLSPAQRVLLLAFEFLTSVHKAPPHAIAEYINAQDEMFNIDGQRVSYYLGQYDVESKRSNGQRVFFLEDVRLALEQWMPEQIPPLLQPSLGVPAVPLVTVSTDLPLTQSGQVSSLYLAGTTGTTVEKTPTKARYSDDEWITDKEMEIMK
jgi:hypothetical protein